MTDYCLKHPWMKATRYLNGFAMCADCAWNALLDGRTLDCPNGDTVRLDEDESVIRNSKKNKRD